MPHPIDKECFEDIVHFIAHRGSKVYFLLNPSINELRPFVNSI